MTENSSTDVTRRAVLAGATVAPLAAGLGSTARANSTIDEAAASAAPPALPAKSAFAPIPGTYLNAGSTHPLPLGARAAVDQYLQRKMKQKVEPTPEHPEPSHVTFARLINAEPDEVTHVPSTTGGENLVLLALGQPEAPGRIVTDALHFFGSHYTYGQFLNAGKDVVTVPMTPEGKTDIDELEAAITDDTVLVAISLVSTINGFQHDLKKVCDIAHAHGAYVYADIIHAAGTVPIDVKATGVDFAACSSYKWLMADMGRAFLFVRKVLQEKIARPLWGYYQVASIDPHLYPYDTPGERPLDFTTRDDAQGYFAMGTSAYIVESMLSYSLPWLERADVGRIQAWRQPMVDAVQEELRKRGYEPLTPLDSKTPLVAFALKDARSKLSERLNSNDVSITVSANRFRVSVGVFNDMNDIDRLLETLPRTI